MIQTHFFAEILVEIEGVIHKAEVHQKVQQFLEACWSCPSPVSRGIGLASSFKVELMSALSLLCASLTVSFPVNWPANSGRQGKDVLKST